MRLSARLRVFGAAALILVGAGCSGTTPPSLQSCVAPTPRQLPSGAAPGTPSTASEGTSTSWGTGPDEVRVASLFVRFSADPGAPSTYRNASVRGQPALLIQIGDPPTAAFRLSWTESGCAFTMILPAGMTRAEALEYGSRY